MKECITKKKPHVAKKETDKQLQLPQTMTLYPSPFTDFYTHFGFLLLSLIWRWTCLPSDPNKLNMLSSLKWTLNQFSSLQTTGWECHGPVDDFCSGLLYYNEITFKTNTIYPGGYSYATKFPYFSLLFLITHYCVKAISWVQVIKSLQNVKRFGGINIYSQYQSLFPYKIILESKKKNTVIIQRTYLKN